MGRNVRLVVRRPYLRYRTERTRTGSIVTHSDCTLTLSSWWRLYLSCTGTLSSLGTALPLPKVRTDRPYRKYRYRTVCLLERTFPEPNRGGSLRDLEDATRAREHTHAVAHCASSTGLPGTYLGAACEARWRRGRAKDAHALECHRCANLRFSEHRGHVMPGCSSDSRPRPRARSS